MKEFEQKGIVQFVDLEGQDEFEKTKAQSTAQNIFEKIKRISKAETSLTVHVKRHDIQGTRKKYSIHARVNWPGHFFEASHTDWDFLTATQSALQALVHEVKKKHEKESGKRRR